MKLTSESFEHLGRIPERCAFGVPDADEHMTLGQNRNPQLSWSELPEGTQSLVLLCVDSDVPTSMDDFNKEGRTISRTLPRTDFIHWVMADIPPETGSIAEGACSDGVTKGGKEDPPGPPGSIQGLNDYTAFMASNPEMQGNWMGYDGPCPPWNDEIPHHYRFRLYALDVPKAGVDGLFAASDLLPKIKPHVIDQVELTGVYSLNPDVT